MVCFDVFYDVVSFDGYLFIHWSGLVLFIAYPTYTLAVLNEWVSEWARLSIICLVDISIKCTFVVQ